jgi:hypothetical protein
MGKGEEGAHQRGGGYRCCQDDRTSMKNPSWGAIRASDPWVRFFGNVYVGGSTIVTPSANIRVSPRIDTRTPKTSAVPSGIPPPPPCPFAPLHPHRPYNRRPHTSYTSSHLLLPSVPGVCAPVLDTVQWYTGHPEAGGCGRDDMLCIPARTVASAASSDISPCVLTAILDSVRPIRAAHHPQRAPRRLPRGRAPAPHAAFAGHVSLPPSARA